MPTRRRRDVVRRKAFAIATTATETVDELWVRIFPDDIAVHTHEPALTENEKIDGASFWAETTAAGNDDALKRGAWKALAQRHGSPRAAWIAKTLAPAVARTAAVAAARSSPDFIAAVETLHRRMNERGSRPAAIERARAPHLKKMIEAADAALAGRRLGAYAHSKAEAACRRSRFRPCEEASQASPDALPGVRASPRSGRTAKAKSTRCGGSSNEIEASPLARTPSITIPRCERRSRRRMSRPRTGHGPKRRILRCCPKGSSSLPSPVSVSSMPSPETRSATSKSASIPVQMLLARHSRLTTDGNLVVGDSIRWMVDFNEAVAKRNSASAFRSRSHEAASGFDELLVIGVREASAADSLTLVQNLVENHHYTAGGMAFLPIGSPTNNTEAEAAAHRSDDDPDRTYDIERGAPLFDVNPPSPFDQADGFRFARAFGLDPAIVGHLAEAGGRGVSEARIMNEALWPATIGAYLEEFLALAGVARTRRAGCARSSART